MFKRSQLHHYKQLRAKFIWYLHKKRAVRYRSNKFFIARMKDCNSNYHSSFIFASSPRFVRWNIANTSIQVSIYRSYYLVVTSWRQVHLFCACDLTSARSCSRKICFVNMETILNGFRSAAFGAVKIKRAPASSINILVRNPVWLVELSITTTDLGWPSAHLPSVGTKQNSTQCSNHYVIFSASFDTLSIQ